MDTWGVNSTPSTSLSFHRFGCSCFLTYPQYLVHTFNSLIVIFYSSEALQSLSS